MNPLHLLMFALGAFTFASLAAETRNPFDVRDHLAETWWNDEETGAFFTNRIAIDATLAKSMADNLPAPPSSENPYAVKRHREARERLTGQPPALAYVDLGFFSPPTNDALRGINLQLSRHTNVALQLSALLERAGQGDHSSAEKLLNFPSRKDLSSNDIAVLKNLFHGFGIDPARDKPAFIVEMMQATHSDDENRAPDGLPAGTAAPDFEIKTLDGKAIRLSDYKGRTVLLHFWSTSCGPCIGEFPEMTKALRPLLQRRKDLIVLAVSLDDSRKVIQEAVKKYDLGDFTHVCDGRGWGSAPARLYRVRGIPTDVVIDPKGIVSGDSWRQVLGRMARQPGGAELFARE